MSTIGIQPNVQQNTYPADKRDTEKSGASNQKRDSTHSQSQSSAHTNTGQSQQLMEAFQLLLPLLTKLIQQYSSNDKPPQQGKPEVKPEPETKPPTETINPDPISLPPPPPRLGIVGTEADDTLKGTYNADSLSGLAGNDRLFGYQGNDTLFGGQGDDDLYGGRGDDRLHGDAGNDYLSGGSGNNQLFGGAGDDILASRLGSDVLDGGQGNDTARIRGNLDDYSVQIGQPDIINDVLGGDISPEYADSIILTHKETGQTVEALNIEQFRFNDASLSFDEMKQRAEPVIEPPQNTRLVELSSSQKQNLFSLFGRDDGHDSNESIRVEDKDGNGKVSIGDIAVLAKGDASSVSQQFKTLTAEDVAKINGEPGSAPQPQELNLTEEQQATIGARFNHKPGPFVADGITTEYTGIATDKDGNGKLSVGDTVQLHVTGGLLGLDETRDQVLTADDIEAIEKDRSNNPLLDISNGLSDEQKERLNTTVFADQQPLSILNVHDGNSDGKLSVGDIITVFHEADYNSPDNPNYGAPGGYSESHTVTQKDLDKYLEGSDTPLPSNNERLVLTDKQNSNLPKLFDNRADFMGIGGIRKILTADDISIINGDKNAPLI